jgi:hypothetical protein
MKKTLFIENEPKFDMSIMETKSLLFEKDYTKFDEIILDASSKGMDLVQSIKNADQIFVSSALSYRPWNDPSILFNNMLFKADEMQIEGKELYFFRELNRINWFRLRKSLFDKVFRKNYLYVEKEIRNYKLIWEQVDIDQLLKDTAWMYQ